MNFKGVSIEYCENNLISYTKIIPTLRKYPQSYIITIDDDVIYSNKLIENLVYKSNRYPNDIIANRIHKIRIINKKPAKYNSWHFNFKKDTKYAFFTGTGGVLYPPKCFHKDILDKKSIMDLKGSPIRIFKEWYIEAEKKVSEPNAFALSTCYKNTPSSRMMLLKDFSSTFISYSWRFSSNEDRGYRC